MRLRFGIKHPFGLFPNGGVIAKNLNESDTKKAESARKSFFEIMNVIVLFVPELKITDEGVELRKFKFIFTITPQ